MSESFLITGASGFIGSNLARHLVNQGRNVHVVVRSSDRMVQVAPDLRDRISIHVTDGTASGMVSILRQAAPRTVFHLATMFRAEHRPEDVDDLIDSNVKFTAQLLDAMVQTGASRIVNASTIWQHYGGARYDPVSLYAATKQAAEDILTYYCNARGVHGVSLVLPDTYGPGDQRRKLLHALSQATRASIPVDFSPGEQLIDLVHIQDVMRALDIAAARTAIPAHERYSISSGSATTLRELAALYSQLSGSPANIRWGGRPYRAREMMRPASSAPPLPDWSAHVPLATGLAELIKIHQP